MEKKIKISELPEFDVTRYLDSEQAIAEYLTVVIEDNDPAFLAAALGDIAKARGMTEVAKKAGITREALYKALRPNASPRFDTINKVCAALGVRLEAKPIHR
ncbi:putative addiction module antidote protein [Desulfoprunum benzoelyticum]|uniref:Putative addiction module antidote protein n=1 Tax=Desulfoprunum benzoelyticum TaxID=1506996 RepID=A0A840V5B8_9BACT|nr:addiction module antidote protein [Desulfoprunum benzoelyticum]MBB5348271.1 putative addiction module antidote protein [Desulfoprunum benzoelyticum]MBM9529538.1 putative addiction module antidote protein [Desulfoprunum benzoelyticum]